MRHEYDVDNQKENPDEETKGVLEWLFAGSAASKLLDFLISYKDFDYSETDIAELSGLSLKTVCREIPKLESIGLVTFTRHVGRAKMYKLNPNSDAVKYLRQFAFAVATKQIDDTLAGQAGIQKTIPDTAEQESAIENNQQL